MRLPGALRWLPIVAFAGTSALACVQAPEPPSSSEADLGSAKFDKNDVLDDATFTDARAVTTSQVQTFFEKTPFRGALLVTHTTSPLSTYEEDGRLASEIVTNAATAYRIDPIVFLVALEAEQSLVSATQLDPAAVGFAFRCGDPAANGGFEKQTECFGTTMRGYLDAQAKGLTADGWKKGLPRMTEDKPNGLIVTPHNEATAALYAYAPVVGKGGGGDASLGGVSKYFELFDRFARALSYKRVPSSDPCEAGACDDAAASASCATSADCAEGAPVCDPSLGQCVACGGDYDPSGLTAQSCPAADKPTCNSDGTCGCANDGACGAGQVCDATRGLAGACVAGCRVSQGVDSCALGSACSATDGSIGACKGVTPSKDAGADASEPADASDAADASAPDTGSDASAPDEGPPPTPPPPPPGSALNPGTPRQPPSGHSPGDRQQGQPDPNVPQFSQDLPPPQGGGVGCSASGGGAGSTGGAALALLACAALLARRARAANAGR